ncbi:hypothetical protein WOLCODRAFT_16983 [Wolfiporia cocos MD-104 SS10]|uniref:Pentacotripeptide-repeat region of PRORP domain-containing protein n=1 Tax=Wolfiporia cocos (strain MD-104) TaxID=742152 RepID=A0A2H3JGC6_WOLCO|nr:hypothetical protein WOLCODRAFT_16983 [Wolfiporia cocos MD-104 SS10]
MPLDAQNTPVWNTIMNEAMHVQRYELAYSLYIDMKRRGFDPTIRTFTTMFSGYSQVRDWSKLTKQLGYVHKLFQSYQDYVQRVKELNPRSPELNVLPVSAYMKILGDIGDWQKMFDVFYEMDDEGPLAPDAYVFTAMIRALQQRRPAALTPEELTRTRLQNASDVRLLWRALLRVVAKNPHIALDSHLVTLTINTLVASRRPADFLFAFDIVRDFLGLAKPGEEPKPVVVPMSGHIMSEVLWLCNVSQKYRLGIHFFKQIADRPLHPGEEPVISRGHVENVIRAYAGLQLMGSGQEASQALEILEWALQEASVHRDAIKRLRPTITTFTLVLGCCWRSGDWPCAARTFELMTGFNAINFLDSDKGGVSLPPQSSDKNIMPDITAMSHLVRTALASEDKANMRQCLRMLNHIGAEMYFPTSLDSVQEDKTDSRGLDVQNPGFYAPRLAKDVIALIKRVLPSDAEQSLSEEENRWVQIGALAKKVPREAVGKVPFLEEHLLGSEKGLAATESAVEHDLTVRRLQRTSRVAKI